MYVLYQLGQLELLHDAGFVHRDVKPDNILFGSEPSSRATPYVIDLGLAKRYVDATTGAHQKVCGGQSFAGTARYASINAHIGIGPSPVGISSCSVVLCLTAQSRRDDLEAFGYVLAECFLGKLPWQGVNGSSNQQMLDRIAKSKLQFMIHDMPQLLPGMCSCAPTRRPHVSRVCRSGRAVPNLLSFPRIQPAA